MIIEPLREGDVLIILSDKKKLVLNEHENNVIDLQNLELADPQHGMIYTPKKQQGNDLIIEKITHSQMGNNVTGVKSQTTLKVRSDATPITFSPIVFRIKNKRMGKLTADTAKKWDPNLTLDQIKKRPQDEVDDHLKALPIRYLFRS